MEADTLEGTRRLLERWIAMTPEQRLEMGETARRCFERRYDMRRNARKIVALFAMEQGERQAATRRVREG